MIWYECTPNQFRKKYSKEMADDLFIKNNNAIINNEDLNLPKPYKEEQKKKGFLKKLFKL